MVGHGGAAVDLCMKVIIFIPVLSSAGIFEILSVLYQS